jgi:hypothetical protein
MCHKVQPPTWGRLQSISFWKSSEESYVQTCISQRAASILPLPTGADETVLNTSWNDTIRR